MLLQHIYSNEILRPAFGRTQDDKERIMIRVAINGYGRIGRIAHRVILEKGKRDIEIVAINAGGSTDIKGWMYLLKYDTAYGPLINHNIQVDDKKDPIDHEQLIGHLIIDGQSIPVFSEKDPSLLPWKELEVDVVIESTGAFRDAVDLKKHIDAGAKAVVLSAPVHPAERGGGEEVPTYVISVNEQNFRGETLISNASCTTNCITPVAKVMEAHFGIEKAMMTTVHGYTSDQRLQDGGHKDYRRARAAGENIIPTSTGATEAAAKALPSLAGKFAGLALRVPVISGSLSDFTFLLKKQTTVEQINAIFTQEAQNPGYQGVLTVTQDPIVSSDIIGSPFSAVIDLSLTQVVGGNLVKVIAWYDNEYGYANRLVEEVVMVGKK